MADKTWDPGRTAQYNGGGTAWDGFAYDPTLDLVYFGTGNASPYDPRQLGPSNGDELFAACILAVHADSGRLAWHYQTTPHDPFDYLHANSIDVASYTGNNGDNRNIATVGFQPAYALIRANDTATGRAANARPSSLAGDNTLLFTAAAGGANRIQALQATGFQLGTSTDVNANTVTYHYLAVRSSAP